MKKTIHSVLIGAVLAAAALFTTQNASAADNSISVYFSPKGGCTEAVVAALADAKKIVLVQAYSFTSAPIAEALVNAHKRGVDVEVILDKSQKTEKYSPADFVQHAGIPVFIDSKHAIAHNKIMVIDSTTIITGSFNFTKAAEESNAENLLVINVGKNDHALADKYIANWNLHLKHSEKYDKEHQLYKPLKKR